MTRDEARTFVQADMKDAEQRAVVRREGYKAVVEGYERVASMMTPEDFTRMRASPSFWLLLDMEMIQLGGASDPESLPQGDDRAILEASLELLAEGFDELGIPHSIKPRAAATGA